MKRILVVNPFGIGDVIFSMILVEALRKALPQARIVFLCNERAAEIVRMNTSIDQTFVFSRDRLRNLLAKHPILFIKKWKALYRAIKKEKFEALFDLSLGREFSFLAACAGIPKRIGFDFKGRGLFLNIKKSIFGYEGRHVVDTQLELLSLAGLPAEKTQGKLPLAVSDRAERQANDFFKSHGLNENDKIIAVAPGGGKSWGPNAVYKQWDPERFAAVVNGLAAVDRLPVVLMGDKSEESLLKQVESLIQHRQVLSMAGEPLEHVCAILRRAQVLLCNDGGLLHLANALGVKTVSLYGPVDERVYGPYPNQTSNAVLTASVPCRPCYNRFRFPPCAHDRRCLTELSVQRVLAAIQSLV